MPGRLKFATASLPLGNLLKAVETYEGQNLHDPVATTVEDLLARIGYGKARGAGSYAADYTQKLKENGFETLSQLQFVTLDGLHQAGIKPGHAGEIFARLKEVLGTPPVQLPRQGSEECACREWAREQAFINLLYTARGPDDRSPTAGRTDDGARRLFTSGQLTNDDWLAARDTSKDFHELRKDRSWKAEILKLLCETNMRNGISREDIKAADSLQAPRGDVRCVACRGEVEHMAMPGNPDRLVAEPVKVFLGLCATTPPQVQAVDTAKMT